MYMLRRQVMYCTQLIDPGKIIIEDHNYILFPNNDNNYFCTSINYDITPLYSFRVYNNGDIIDNINNKIIWRSNNRKSSLREIYYNRRPTNLTPLRIFLDCFLINKSSFNSVSFIDNDPTNLNFNNLYFQATEYGNAICGTGFIEIPDYTNFIIDIKPDHFIETKEEEYVISSELKDVVIYKNGLITDSKGKDIRKLNKEGYINIYRKGKRLLAHRLVAEAFIPNPMNYEIVNHINGNRSDNHMNNLEWVNNNLNIIHGDVRNSWYFKSNYLLHKSISSEPFLNYSISSSKIIDFIAKRLTIEKPLPPEYWIFSNTEPFRVLFLILIKHEIFKDTELPYFLKESSVLKSLNFQQQVLLMNEYSNKHVSIADESCHILNMLQKLDIGVRDYLHWIIFDLKKILKDDVGFIYADEIKLFKSIMTYNTKAKVYMNTVLEFTNNRCRKLRFDNQNDSFILNIENNNKLSLCVANPVRNIRLVEPIDFITEKGGTKKISNSRKLHLNRYYNFWHKPFCTSGNWIGIL